MQYNEISCKRKILCRKWFSIMSHKKTLKKRFILHVTERERDADKVQQEPWKSNSTRVFLASRKTAGGCCQPFQRNWSLTLLDLTIAGNVIAKMRVQLICCAFFNYLYTLKGTKGRCTDLLIRTRCGGKANRCWTKQIKSSNPVLLYFQQNYLTIYHTKIFSQAPWDLMLSTWLLMTGNIASVDWKQDFVSATQDHHSSVWLSNIRCLLT